MQVKVCGITRPEDGRAASALGADAVGLVFWSGSKRAVTVQRAEAICAQLAPFVTVTALLVNAREDEVAALIDALPINLLQFHGDESPTFCEQWSLPYIRALRAEAGADIMAQAARYPNARGFLLDAVHQGQFGGTGTAFDWALVPQEFSRPLILAGGLNPANVAEGIRQVGPQAVDVSSGVESAPGVKDHDKMRRFIEAARAAHTGQSS